MKNLKLRHKGLLIVGLPVVLTTILTIVLLQLLLEAESQLKDEAFAARVIAITSQLQTHYFEASASAYNYLMTRSEFQQYKFDKALSKIEKLEKRLSDTLSQNEQQKKMAKSAIEKGKVTLKTLKTIRNGAPLYLGGDIDIRALHIKLVTNPENQGKIFKKIIDYGKLIEKNAPKENAHLRTTIFYYASALVLLNFALALFLAFYFTRNITGRLNTISENAIRLASANPLSGHVSGTDEISELDTTFRTMAKQLEQSRRKEKALMDNAVNVLVSIDQEFKIVNISHACQSAWGYKEEELLGARVAILFNESHQEQYLDLFKSKIGEEKEGTFDTTLVKDDGEEIEVRWDAHWSSSERALFCVVTDITEQKRLQELKQRLMDTVAHDLRSPISSIRATLNLITMGVLGAVPDKVLDRVSKAETQSDRLIRLINDLLDFERLDSGGVKLYISQTTIDNIVNESVDAVQESANKASVRLIVKTDATEIEADADRLIQMLVNLLGNAVKYSSKDQEISIKSSVRGNVIEVKVSDQGPGIPEDQIKSIFERFKMVENSTEHKKPGSGLGLSIAREIVELHGGRIGVTNNRPQPGCTFWFTIPIKAIKSNDSSE